MPFYNKEILCGPNKKITWTKWWNIRTRQNNFRSNLELSCISTVWPAFGCLRMLSWLVEPAYCLFLFSVTTNIHINNKICIAKDQSWSQKTFVSEREGEETQHSWKPRNWKKNYMRLRPKTVMLLIIVQQTPQILHLRFLYWFSFIFLYLLDFFNLAVCVQVYMDRLTIFSFLMFVGWLFSYRKRRRRRI